VGNPNVGGSDHGGDADRGRYTPSNVYDYSNVPLIQLEKSISLKK
jgi:hypothetical protein